jgi:hypothetical protein
MRSTATDIPTDIHRLAALLLLQVFIISLIF